MFDGDTFRHEGMSSNARLGRRTLSFVPVWSNSMIRLDGFTRRPRLEPTLMQDDRYVIKNGEVITVGAVSQTKMPTSGQKRHPKSIAACSPIPGGVPIRVLVRITLNGTGLRDLIWTALTNGNHRARRQGVEVVIEGIEPAPPAPPVARD